MFAIDITPLVNVGLELLAGALLALGSWAVARLAGKIGIEMDDKARAYVREAVTGGLDYALKEAKRAGQDLGHIEVRNALVASAANYVVAQVPDGVRRLKLSRGNVENMVRRLLPE